MTGSGILFISRFPGRERGSVKFSIRQNKVIVELHWRLHHLSVFSKHAALKLNYDTIGEFGRVPPVSFRTLGLLSVYSTFSWRQPELSSFLGMFCVLTPYFWPYKLPKKSIEFVPNWSQWAPDLEQDYRIWLMTVRYCRSVRMKYYKLRQEWSGYRPTFRPNVRATSQYTFEHSCGHTKICCVVARTFSLTVIAAIRKKG